MSYPGPVVLLVRLSSGDVAAVRFPSSGAADRWVDRHPSVEDLGVRPLVSPADALRDRDLCPGCKGKVG